MTESHHPAGTPGPGSTLGTVLAGRYRLEQRVGRGGMADVYRARDELLHRTVAVKLFRFDTADTDRARIDAEMRTLAGLRHAGLVTLYDAGTDDDSAPYLVMEFIDGTTLRDRIGNGPALAPAEVAALGADLAASLRYVHANGVVHRDVKPANILLDPPTDGARHPRPRLTDFGIAQITDGARLTADGTALGTPNYVSPEQTTGRPIGPASDIYSLGLVLLEALTGRPAYPGSGVEAALARLHRPPLIPADLGPGWGRLLTAMTELDPAARPDIGAVIGGLHALAGAGAAAPDDTIASWEAMPAGATSVMSATTTMLPAAGPARDPLGTTVLPVVGAAAGRPLHRPRRRPNAVYLIGGLIAAAIVVVLLVLGLGGTSAGTGPNPGPAYPSVPGQLGRHLDILEGTLS
ncbi:MAG TPA: serine/threonine-protein kinase [Jatrophihabitans sp.]|jgi:serine/threonine protein kinase|uniref:serine/threonine-protein kinase n=1 Tax=Jatrophihabitans sp. TaxID=1932789 RepID=UPI002E062DF5|nr:serine/threonine-protein kinase [Jatrophihabitans sp.]